MNKKRIFPALVCGFGAAVLTTIPGIKSLGCCLIVPAAAIFAILLDNKINKIKFPIDFKSAIFFGILTGLFAAFFSSFFEVLITYVARTNDFVEALPQTEIMIRQYNLGAILDQTLALLHQMVREIQTSGFSPLYTMGIFMSNIIIDSIFGMLGGLLGMAYFNKRSNQ